MTLLRELIEIPTQVHQGDFVLKLTEGVNRREQTLDQYVVTGQLARCFDSALGLIRSAVEDGSSKAAYLHGSFGSGKSHFMAVLTMLLEGYQPVRERADLAPVVDRHDDWMKGRRFLVVPYHLIGATSMEAAVLGGYARFIREHHHDAPPPAIYSSAPIFANARQLRTQLGDERFFDQLNESAESGNGGWGALEAGWGADRFEAALEAAPGTDEHDALLSSLLRTLLTAYQGVVSESGFVSLDEGLAAISRHARDLGYDALVLFLDELILWLASHMADRDFVATEGQKVAKLVEAQIAERPVPIVSFVARQRDLRELVGDHVPGAEQLGFADVLGWWEGRFSTITLEDRNLPEIAERRVLRPRSAEARRQIDEAFRETERVREEVWRTLLTSDADRELFRKTYPFSPAFMKVLVGVSGALQRERTALKVMVQLLVDQRDELELGDLVPVGDLFDVIAAGDEPFTEQMRGQFEAARRLYTTKLRPLLLSFHGLEDDDTRDLAPSHPFRTDDRLVKTLLLAALVPEVEPLRGLTAGRLAALNHGTITSPIPGEERTIVLQRVREWAAQVAEIKVSEDHGDPLISIQLSGVDVESILDQARHIDTDGERRRRVRAMVLEALGVGDVDRLLLDYRFLWRGTQRALDLTFGNVRSATEVPDASLASDGDRWRLIVDFPFDAPGHGGADDRERLEAYRANNPPTQTVCWLPVHFTPQLEKDLGRLVVLEHVLSGERFATYASHLAPTDQSVAKAMLDGQRLNLVQRVRSAVEQAYGIAAGRPEMVDTATSQDEIFVSLQSGFSPRPPVAANLREGADALAGQMLAYQFPAHPEFGGEVKPRDAEHVYQEVVRAARTEDGRIHVPDAATRKLLLRIANPLKLGVMYEAHFVLGDHWVQHVERQMAAAAQRGEEGALTVGRLRAWFDVPQPMGLPRFLQDLVIMAFADQTNRSFQLHGGPVAPRIGGLDDDMELVQQELPSPADWELAGRRAAAIFGIDPRPLLNAANLRELARELGERAAASRAAVADVRQRLEQHATQLELSEDADRLRTARAADQLLRRLGGGAASPVEAIRALVDAEIPTTEQALARAITNAGPVAAALSSVKWELLDALEHVDGEDAERAQDARQMLVAASRADEFATPLADALRRTEAEAVDILARRIGRGDDGRPTSARVPLSEARQLVEDLAGRLGEDAVITLSWTEPSNTA